MKVGLAMAALLLAALVPTAHATSPQPPWWVQATLDDAPRTGTSVTLRIAFTANSQLDDAPFHLVVPDWVRVEGSKAWRVDAGPGQTRVREWIVTPTAEGFWTAGIEVRGEDGSSGGGWCCLHAYSTRESARWSSPHAEGTIPPGRADHKLTFRVLDAERVELIYRVEPKSDWMRHTAVRAELVVFGPTPDRVVSEAPEPARIVVPLKAGGEVVITQSANALVAFDGAAIGDQPVKQGVPLRCENVLIARDGDTVTQRKTWSCEGLARKPLPTLGVPLLLATWGVLAVCLRAEGIRVRCNHWTQPSSKQR